MSRYPVLVTLGCAQQSKTGAENVVPLWGTDEFTQTRFATGDLLREPRPGITILLKTEHEGRLLLFNLEVIGVIEDINLNLLRVDMRLLPDDPNIPSDLTNPATVAFEALLSNRFMECDYDGNPL